jgi:hypothetical protein
MKSGNIQQYSHLSEFTTVKEFNKSNRDFIVKYGDNFTKGERIAFDQITRYSVKIIGVCNARICKLVAATHNGNNGISRSTFERMLRKAKQYKIITVQPTTRKKGGSSHNVYIFHRFDRATEGKMTEQVEPKCPEVTTVSDPIPPSKTTIIENYKKNILQDLRPITLETLDYTYTPSHVPQVFTKIVRPFFNKAKKICELWDRALIAYRKMRFDDPIEQYLPTIIQAFKETVYRYKQGKIKTDFTPYYYSVLAAMLIVEKRKIVATTNRRFHNWLRS